MFSKINTVSSQKFITKRALTYLKIAEILDNNGQYDFSEYTYNQAKNLYRFAQIPEENDEPEEIIEEPTIPIVQNTNVEDVEKNLSVDTSIDDIDNYDGRFDAKYIAGHYFIPGVNDPVALENDPKLHVNLKHIGYYLDEDIYIDGTGDSNLTIKIVKALGEGGKDIKKSLQSLANVWSHDPDFTYCNGFTLRHSLAHYYKNPLFLIRDEYLITDTLKRHIIQNNIDSFCVQIISELIKKYQLLVDSTYSQRELVGNYLSENLNESDKNKLVSFFIKKYNNVYKDVVDSYNIPILLKAMEFSNSAEIISAYYEFMTLFPTNFASEKIQNFINQYKDSKIDDVRFLIYEIFNLYLLKVNFEDKSKTKKIVDFILKHPELSDLENKINIDYDKFIEAISVLPDDSVVNALASNNVPNLSYKMLDVQNEDEIYKKYPELLILKPFYQQGLSPKATLLYLKSPKKAIEYFKMLFDHDNRNLRTTIEYVNFFNLDIDIYLDYMIKYFKILIASANKPDLYKKFDIAYYYLGENILNIDPVILLNFVTHTVDETGMIYGGYSIEDIFKLSNETEQYRNSNKYSNVINLYFDQHYNFETPFDTIEELRDHFKELYGIDINYKTAGRLLAFGFEKKPEFEIFAKHTDIPKYLKKEFIGKIGEEIIQSNGYIGRKDNFFKKCTSLLDGKYANLPYYELDLIMIDDSYDDNYNKLLEIKKSISISKNYKSITPGSREYIIILNCIFKNYGVRGRDPKLLVDCFDYVVNSFAKSSYMSILRMPSILEKSLSAAVNATEDQGEQLDIVTLGSRIRDYFSKYYIENNKTFLRNVYDEDLQKIYSAYQTPKGNLTDFVDRLTYLFINPVHEFITTNKIDVHHGSNEAIIRKIEDLIRDSESNDNILNKISLINLDKNKSLNVPVSYYVKSQSDLDQSDKSLMLFSLMQIVNLFGNLTNEMLNKFTREIYTKQDIQKFTDIPDDDKSDFINQVMGFLPSVIEHKDYLGLAQFYGKYFSKSKAPMVKRIAFAWNNKIKIFENNGYEQFNIVPLNTIVYKYTLEEIGNMLSLSTMSNILDNLGDVDQKFLTEFSTWVSIDDNNTEDEDYKHKKRFEFLFLEDIYNKGKTVRMPDFSNYNHSIDGITLKFLPRDDTRCLFIGNYGSFCQNPYDFAATCAIDSVINPGACLMVFEKNNSLIASSYVWTDIHRNICCDSIEVIGTSHMGPGVSFAITKLLKKFAESQSDKLVTLGKSKVNLDYSLFGDVNYKFPLMNPTDSYKNPRVIQFLEDSNNPNELAFYDDDVTSQDVISDNRDYSTRSQYRADYWELYVPSKYNNYDDYPFSDCLACEKKSYDDSEDKCKNCDFEASEATTCPLCHNETYVRSENTCEFHTCNFEYQLCPNCYERSYYDGNCNECGYGAYSDDDLELNIEDDED